LSAASIAIQFAGPLRLMVVIRGTIGATKCPREGGNTWPAFFPPNASARRHLYQAANPESAHSNEQKRTPHPSTRQAHYTQATFCSRIVSMHYKFFLLHLQSHAEEE
jgi:hypothetical protein